MMISPVTMAIAAITVMLWILWSDTIRRQRPSAILYALRIALYLIVSFIMILNLVRYPHVFAGSARAVALLTVVVGFVGAGYFARKMVLRR
jgi:hypothetical protein